MVRLPYTQGPGYTRVATLQIKIDAAAESSDYRMGLERAESPTDALTFIKNHFGLSVDVFIYRLSLFSETDFSPKKLRGALNGARFDPDLAAAVDAAFQTGGRLQQLVEEAT